MGKLLFDESPLVVQPTLAKAIGLNEAIVLQQVNYWLNTKGSGKVINGERWIYNTVKEWQEQFPFWSESTITRTLDNLEGAKLIKTGNYNKSGMDRTKWYTVNFATLELLNVLIEQEKDMTNAFSQNDKMEDSNLTECNLSEWQDIPETTTETPSDILSQDDAPPSEYDKTVSLMEKAFFEFCGGTLSGTFYQKFRPVFEKNSDHRAERLNHAISRMKEKRTFFALIDGYMQWSEPKPAPSRNGQRSAPPVSNRYVPPTEAERKAFWDKLRPQLERMAQERASG